jgi:hypothetical protein
MANRPTTPPADSEPPDVELTLTTLQVEAIVRQAQGFGDDGFAERLLATLEVGCGANGGSRGRAIARKVRRARGNAELSESLLRGLAVLACCGSKRQWRSNLELARGVGLSPSTTHRYIKTLCAVGLLEQDPTTRAYRPVTA